VNVNVAAADEDFYKELKNAGIGTYILFQETYYRPAYEQAHISGPKADYDRHTFAFDRAIQAGIDDVGGGVLFGLYDWQYDALALMLHNNYLEEKFGVGFHTVSLPRIRQSEGAALDKYPHGVSDEDFLYLTAVIRLSLPFTGMIISTRETPSMRKKLIECGVSQLSGGSAVDVGGYTRRLHSSGQFNLADERSAQDILLWLMDEDLIPSFCTACYRNNRTGDRFMQLAKSGEIKHVCLPNALMTLAEYAEDYGSPTFKEKSEALITKKIADIKNPKVKEYTQACVKGIRKGERDLFI
jgi:2-iminoacetate synthase